MGASLEYNTDLFERETIERIAAAVRECCWRGLAEIPGSGCRS